MATDDVTLSAAAFLQLLGAKSAPAAPAETPVPIDERSMSRREFCEAEGISLSTYHKMRKAGTAPEETRIPGLALTRITAEARRAWHKRIAEYQHSADAKLEAARRSALARQNGERAAKSAKHVSKRS